MGRRSLGWKIPFAFGMARHNKACGRWDDQFYYMISEDHVFDRKLTWSWSIEERTLDSKCIVDFCFLLGSISLRRVRTSHVTEFRA